jgi:hypothetical protein
VPRDRPRPGVPVGLELGGRAHPVRGLRPVAWRRNWPLWRPPRPSGFLPRRGGSGR